ncbi:thiamine biosynthesis protein ApbE [Rhodobacteraceae bacterium EhC02]|nr:thiamine biosynthesis protein ApbE [Rhodobacteraceae bacterium EhC02]
MVPVAALLADGRLHLQHGPIDLVIGVEAQDDARSKAYRAARDRFATVLDELVPELPVLRAPLGGVPQGLIARRMHRACMGVAQGDFITPMAAVAGSVADEVLAAMLAAVPLARAHVNNGGDIALHLAPGADYRAAIAGLDGQLAGRITLHAGQGIGGIATSGQGGRSLSLGIASSVTVLARDAATADAAATLIANAVDLPGHPAITRRPARDIFPDSDLGARMVVTDVAPLPPADIARALSQGVTRAQAMIATGAIAAAALVLQGQGVTVGEFADGATALKERSLQHA